MVFRWRQTKFLLETPSEHLTSFEQFLQPNPWDHDLQRLFFTSWTNSKRQSLSSSVSCRSAWYPHVLGTKNTKHQGKQQASKTASWGSKMETEQLTLLEGYFTVGAAGLEGAGNAEPCGTRHRTRCSGSPQSMVLWAVLSGYCPPQHPISSTTGLPKHHFRPSGLSCNGWFLSWREVTLVSNPIKMLTTNNPKPACVMGFPVQKILVYYIKDSNKVQKMGKWLL